jgi:hypothetical protein
MKIGVGIPHRSDIKMRTMLSIISNIPTFGCDSSIIVTSGPFIHWSREMLYDAAVKQECTHLVFVDTDMAFPPTAIRQLIDHKKDIIGIVAYKKIIPKLACVRIKEGVEIGEDEVPKELFRCDEVGTGLMAIDIERVQRIPRPLFDAPAIRPDPAFIPMGEDLYFCRKARAWGLEVWCDPTIEVKHIGDYEY